MSRDDVQHEMGDRRDRNGMKGKAMLGWGAVQDTPKATHWEPQDVKAGRYQARSRVLLCQLVSLHQTISKPTSRKKTAQKHLAN